MGKILVTGGAGFIGSALIHGLNKRGIDDIIVCDILPADDRWRNLAPLSFSDYMDGDDLISFCRSKSFSELDYVFHFGACSSTTETDVRFLLKNNFALSRDLALASVNANAKFVYASSAATYGDGMVGMDDSEEQLEKYRPLNPYGYSKHLFDLFAKRRGLQSKIIGLKFFNVFGPNEAHKGEMRSVVAKGFDEISDTGRLRLFKSQRDDFRDGEQERDFIYVKDAVKMALHLALHPENCGIFNIGSGTASTWNKLATALFRAMEREEKIEFIEMPKNIQKHYQYSTRADISKLKATGYDAGIRSLQEAVGDYVKNHLITGVHLGDEKNNGKTNSEPV